jgi:molybdopterin/thiamine biosynthesis adenylyltransferase
VFIKTVSHLTKDRPRIYIIDGDTLEARNLERQLFDHEHVSKNKAEALVSKYRGEYNNLVSGKKYFGLGSRIKDKSLVFVFVDNHPARRAVLDACDRHDSVAIMGANEYTDAQAIYYSPIMKGTKMDPRVRYPEILSDEEGDPMRPRGCSTGEALTIAPQLAIANFASASHALQLFWFYNSMVPKMDISSKEHWPIEHTNNFSRMDTRSEKFYA